MKGKLEPPLPEAKDTLVIPKYFGMIRGGGLGGHGKAPLIEIPPRSMSKVDKVPGIVMGGAPAPASGVTYPSSAPEPEKVPILVRAARRFRSLFVVEPERPVTMPTVPELNYPPLYTRYPVMKTVTKVTDGNGKIQVDFSHLFQEVPGVVMTVQGEDAWSGNVFQVTTTYFRAIFFKAAHDHGGVVDDGGLHTPSVNADGNHSHPVEGTITWDEYSQYGYLVASDWSDYETEHLHTQVQTQLEDEHKHHVYPTQYDGGHDHSIPHTDGPDDTDPAMTSLNWGSDCVSGSCIESFNAAYFANDCHWHYFSSDTGYESNHRHTNIQTAHGDAHRHLLNNTGVQPSPGHRHQIGYPEQYDHYITDIDIDAFLSATSYETPYHDHSADEVPEHDHVVALDGGLLLKNTSVTITYLAQVET